MAMEVERSFVAGMARFQRRVKDVAIALRLRFPKRSVQHAVEFWDGDGASIKLYIELAIEPGRYLCWWIVVTPAEIWRVSTFLAQNDGSGEEIFSEREFTAATTPELFDVLTEHLKTIEAFHGEATG